MLRPNCSSEHLLFIKLLDDFPNIVVNQIKLCKFEYGQSSNLDEAAKGSLGVCSMILDENKLPRGDYVELAELVKFFLSPDDYEIQIRQPGAVHHARLMIHSI